MNQEYVISFSSFYKAAYAQDMLEEAGIAYDVVPGVSSGLAAPAAAAMFTPSP